MTTKYEPQYRYHAPLREKPESDLLYAIRHNHHDSAECRRELYRRGWTDQHIDGRTP